MTIEQIDGLCEAYSLRRGNLFDRLSTLEAELNAVKKRHLKEIKKCTVLAAETEARLREALEATPDLFDKPKTQIFHGIKVGFRKGKGKMEWEYDAVVVARIKKLFPDMTDELIITTEKPCKTALDELESGDLRKLGVSTEDAGEQVVIKPVETAVEKLVKALLKDTRESDAEAAT